MEFFAPQVGIRSDDLAGRINQVRDWKFTHLVGGDDGIGHCFLPKLGPRNFVLSNEGFKLVGRRGVNMIDLGGCLSSL